MIEGKGDSRLALASYQQQAVDALRSTIRKVVEYHAANPGRRRQVALEAGAMLLQAPTGSGKTLMLGRALEALRGDVPCKVVWFWFAPYSGLVTQTREALAEQCSSLRLRDIYADREPGGSRDGDVFVQTWSAVAARNKEARKVRRSTESARSIDDMIEDLRGDGFSIGVVIDEAHLNFGASAQAAADFYLSTLQPDFTILATATPNDEKLEQFEQKAGIEVPSRIIIARTDVVAAGLNKRGLMLGYLRFQTGDADLIDLEQATLTAAWIQHEAVKKRLLEKGVRITPLMLVQVEDQAKGGDDPVQRVREKLTSIGVLDSAIAVHTSGEPDPEFHTLAYDPTKEVLIFKVAVATGFDAPRAWTLVSVRPNRGKEFGLQIVGRIMRVHPLVRPIHGTDDLLDRGYVFLTDTELQAGLSSAVDELKAVRQSIDLITDQLDVVEFGNAASGLMENAWHKAAALGRQPPATPEERQHRLASLIDAGLVLPQVLTLTPELQDKAIETGEAVLDLSQTPLFGDLPIQARPQDTITSGSKNHKRYDLRQELGLPPALLREIPPEPHEFAGELVADIAREFCRNVDLIAELHRRKRKASLNLKDLFEGDEVTTQIDVRLSAARIAERAQLAFRFNDSVDPRVLKRALVDAFRSICDDRGIEYQETDLRRAIDLVVMREPERLKDALREALARRVRLSDAEPIPAHEYGPEGLAVARRAAYGVFPANMNGEERAFAEFLDEDSSGTVKWWIRNPENALWATRLILPNGRRFFPDFAVGVSGRTSRDTIALVEIKDDGVTGRLQSDSNVMKIRVQHREYKNVFWTYRDETKWVRARFDDGLHRIIPRGVFNISEMIYLQ